MALAPALGAAGLVFGSTMVLLERTGKAVRSPAKSVLLAVAAAQRRPWPRVRRAQGARPGGRLARAAASSPASIALTGHTSAGLAVLAVPGAIALGVLAWMHRYVGDPAPRPAPPRRSARVAAAHVLRLRRGLRPDHRRADDLRRDLLPPRPRATSSRPRVVPVVYAAAMGAEAVASLGTGFAYDRVGAATLLLLPAGRGRRPGAGLHRPGRGSRSPGSCCGARPPGCRTPRSRRWSPTSSRRRGWPRRTARSRPSRPWRRSSAACSPAGCTTSHRSALVGVIGRAQVMALVLLVVVLAPQATRPGAVGDPRTRVRSMSATPSSYSITMRLHTAPDHGVVGRRRDRDRLRRRHRHRDRRRRLQPRPPRRRRHLLGRRRRPRRACWSTRSSEVEGVEVHKVSDRTFLLHIGGKIEVTSKVPLRTRDDLSMAYTPGRRPGQHGARRATPRTCAG